MAEREAVATELVRRLRAAGHDAYFAGGCVRDRLLGREPLDYDIATSAPPETVQALFPRTVPVGAQFGVVLVVTDAETVQALFPRTVPVGAQFGVVLVVTDGMPV